MLVLTVMNQKGGVGKTTTTLNLAVALKERGWRVLVVDFDPQGSLTTCCGLNDPNLLAPGQTVADAVLTTVHGPSVRHVALRDIIVSTPAGIDLVPASQQLATAEAALYTVYGREFALRDTLADARNFYDVILVDSVPTLGLLAVNALAAADGLIIPVQAEYLAVYGLAQLLHSVALVRERLNPRLHIWGVLLTMVDARTRHSRDVVTIVRETLPGQVPVFQTHIPVDVKLKDSAKLGLSVLALDPSCRAALAYRDLASEVGTMLKNATEVDNVAEGVPTDSPESLTPSGPPSVGANRSADSICLATRIGPPQQPVVEPDVERVVASAPTWGSDAVVPLGRGGEPVLASPGLSSASSLNMDIEQLLGVGPSNQSAVPLPQFDGVSRNGEVELNGFHEMVSDSQRRFDDQPSSHAVQNADERPMGRPETSADSDRDQGNGHGVGRYVRSFQIVKVLKWKT